MPNTVNGFPPWLRSNLMKKKRHKILVLALVLSILVLEKVGQVKFFTG